MAQTTSNQQALLTMLVDTMLTMIAAYTLNDIHSQNPRQVSYVDQEANLLCTIEPKSRHNSHVKKCLPCTPMFLRI